MTAEEERAAIAAWLRGLSEYAIRINQDTNGQTLVIQGLCIPANIASAIERGDHHKGSGDE